MAGSLDPAVLDKLAGLSLVARTVVDGYLAGQHRSPRRGSSAEFAQHREYVPGDELRRIDWKVFARSDRLVIKEFDDEISRFELPLWSLFTAVSDLVETPSAKIVPLRATDDE